MSLADKTVEIDRAMAEGMLGYPDILHKQVCVSQNSAVVVVGRVTALGPLGFVVAWTHGSTSQTFVGWGSVAITWDNEDPPPKIGD